MAKDIEFEGKQPGILQIPKALDERKIKAWWIKFKASQKYNAARLNCSTTVYLALKAGGAGTYVQDPGNWWWDPDRVLDYAIALTKAILAQKRGLVQFAAPQSQRAQALQQAKLKSDANAQKNGIRFPLQSKL